MQGPSHLFFPWIIRWRLGHSGRGDRPPIGMKAVEKVEAHIADAVKKGAKVAPGSATATPLVRSEVAVDAAARQVQAGFPGHTMNG
jgi:hypothetical protein